MPALTSARKEQQTVAYRKLESRYASICSILASCTPFLLLQQYCSPRSEKMRYDCPPVSGFHFLVHYPNLTPIYTLQSLCKRKSVISRREPPPLAELWNLFSPTRQTMLHPPPHTGPWILPSRDLILGGKCQRLGVFHCRARGSW